VEIKIQQPNRFFKLSSPKGYQRTCFFPRIPLVTNFDLSEPTSLTGYISFRYFMVNSMPYGVLFESIRSRTEVKEYVLKVGLPEELSDAFDPIYLLEKMGVLLFKANDSSILAIPSDIHSSLLVRAE